MSNLPTTARTDLHALLACLLMLAVSTPLDAQWSIDQFSSIEARNIGPAGMSGRVTVVDVDPSDHTRIFVGAAAGGVWRSEDGGITWHSTFDDQPVQSIGHLAVSAANTDLVWVGTGEGNPRQSVSIGRGVFRSTDGGDTWTHVGLEASERISRVIAHPTDPDIAYVGAMGPLWSDGEERGLYRTTDRGATWERVLYVDARTGVADMIMDPSNPEKIFVAMYDHRRTPWIYESGGPGSGLYVTRDGGDSWTKLGPANGVPSDPLGRIGLAISPSSPEVVYALVEAETNALLRSDDGGKSWRTVSDESGINPRPMYYADIRVDPLNENRVYRLAGSTDVSEDAGRTWRTTVPSNRIHGDVHELWIDPGDPRHMIMGNDGGLGITYDRGDRWRFVENLPLSQFYQTSVDMAMPFNVYGGVQDSGGWMGPSNVWDARGIVNAHWRRISCCDGFEVRNDFSDPRFGYSLTQNGDLKRFDKVTMERRRIRPAAPEGESLRYNWNTAFSVDAHDSTTIYFGSQYVHRSSDQGMSWQTISPDLTSPDPAKYDPSPAGTPLSTEPDNHNTILSIDASPLEQGVIWVSTDDGNVQLTRDDGASWTNFGGELPGAPDSAYVPQVKASRHVAGGAYAVVDNHRRGDMGPYVYRTGNYGESWERLPTEGISDFFHVIEEDPVEPNLLFLGGELGLYVSMDRGGSWIHWTHDFATVPVREVIVHPRDHDLVVGTHGRAIWIIDDIRPLRELARDASIRGRVVHAFEPPPAYQHVVALEGDAGIRMGYRVVGDAMFFGDSRPYGALLSYWVNDAAAAGTAELEVADEGGRVVRHLTGSADVGVNRVAWDLHMDRDWAGGSTGGQAAPPEVLPGSYQVTVRLGGQESSTTVEVIADPRQEVTMGDRRAKLTALREVAGWIAVAGEARARVGATLTAVNGIVESLDDSEADRGLFEDGHALGVELEATQGRLFPAGFGGGPSPFSALQGAYRALSSSSGAPSANDRAMIDAARDGVEEILREVNQIFSGPVSDFRATLGSHGYAPIKVPEALRIGG